MVVEGKQEKFGKLKRKSFENRILGFLFRVSFQTVTSFWGFSFFHAFDGTRMIDSLRDASQSNNAAS